MITHIKGKLVEKNPSFVVIDCNGVGYMIRISLHTFSQLHDSELCSLYTHLSVKEDSHSLYGFFDRSERELFRLLISVSGIGTNTAQTILSSLSPEEAQQAILSENVAALQSVKGIGAKTAQRVILDLKDKIAKQGISINESSVLHNTTREEALSALTMLGFSKNLVNKALDKELKSQSNLKVEELVKRVLKNL
ncbi:MAG: Holliday junction branch migration protein RuvA [Flavobacteriales bacterium]